MKYGFSRIQYRFEGLVYWESPHRLVDKMTFVTEIGLDMVGWRLLYRRYQKTDEKSILFEIEVASLRSCLRQRSHSKLLDLNWTEPSCIQPYALASPGFTLRFWIMSKSLEGCPLTPVSIDPCTGPGYASTNDLWHTVHRCAYIPFGTWQKWRKHQDTTFHVRSFLHGTTKNFTQVFKYFSVLFFSKI